MTEKLTKIPIKKRDNELNLKLKINGEAFSQDVADHTLLVDFLRESIGMTGTHIGCDTTQCGAHNRRRNNA